MTEPTTRTDRRPRRLRTPRAIVTAIAAASLATGVAGGAVAAFAQQAELPPSATAWYQAPTAGTPLPAPGQPPEQVANPTEGLPVGLQNAEHQYRSALKFDLPALPEGATVTKFEVTLHEDASSGTVTGVEACAFAEPFEPAPNQRMSELPEFNCTFSTTVDKGEDDPNTPETNEGAIWKADLSVTAEAWIDGTLPNNGFVLQFLDPDNLPVGQPDPRQSNGQVTFSGPESEDPPVAVLEYTVATTGTTTDSDLLVPPPSSSGSSSGTAGGDDGFAFRSSPALESDGSSSGAFDSGPAPQVAPPEAAPEEAAPEDPVAAPAQPEPVVAGARSPTTPAYVWSLLFLIPAGLYVIARSLVAEPAVAIEREGAVTRLMSQRRAEAGAASAPTNPLLQV